MKKYADAKCKSYNRDYPKNNKEHRHNNKSKCRSKPYCDEYWHPMQDNASTT